MTPWTVLLLVAGAAALIGLWFGTARALRSGQTPPGPIDAEAFVDSADTSSEPAYHAGEGRGETIAEEMQTQGKDLGHG